MCIRDRTCIADLIITQSAIYSSYPDSDMENRKRFMEFDRKAKELRPEIYELSSVKSGKLRLLRKYNFKHYRLIPVSYTNLDVYKRQTAASVLKTNCLTVKTIRV